MKEYIKISNFIKDVLEIDSYYLNEYFKFINYQIVDNKISMDLLREYYKKCRLNREIEKFNRTINEMAMRGFQFIRDKNTGILPEFSLPLEINLLIPKAGTSNFNNINFNSFDLSDFLNQYKVSNDNFFLEFPLEGLLYLNSKININDLEEKFRNNGFNIIKIEKKLKEEEYYKDIQNNIFLDKKESEAKIVISNEIEKINREIKVKKYFEGTSYLHFIKFCNENKIENIFDITKKVLKEYKVYKGTGERRYENIVQKLSEVEDFFLENLLEEPLEIESYDLNVDLDEEYLINIVFKERKFEKIREYSIKRGLKYIYEITSEILSDFGIQPKIGNLKYKLVKERYEEVIKKIDFKEIEKREVEALGKVESLSDYAKELQLGEIIEITSKSKKSENLKLLSIEGKEYKELLKLEILSQSEILELSKKLKKLNSLDEIFNNIEIEEAELILLIERFIENKTLEEVGKKRGVSRERVRQREVKSLKKIKKQLEINCLKEIFKWTFRGKNQITENEFKVKLSKKNEVYVDILKRSDILNYSDELEIFLIEKINIEGLKKVFSEFPEVFNLYDELERLDEILKSYSLEELSIENCEKLFEGLGFKKYKNHYIKKRFSYRKIFSIIFRDYIDNSLRIDKIGVEKLKKIASKEFGIELFETELSKCIVRSTDSNVSNSEDVLLVGPKEYKHYSKIKYNEELINEAEKLFEECRKKEKDYISIEEIMMKFREKKLITEIETKHVVYSILKYNLEEQYTFGNKNTLQINFNDIKLSREEQLINFLNLKGGTVEKREILKELKWKETKLEDTISKSQKIILMENSFLTTIDNIILTNEEIEKIESHVNKMMKEKEYLSLNVIYGDMKFNEDLYSVLKKNRINSSSILCSILKKKNIIKKYKYSDRGMFILALDSKIENIQDVIQLKFSDGIYNRELISDFYEEQGYQRAMVSTGFDRLLEQGLIVLVSKDKFILSKNMDIDNSVIEKLNEIIERELVEKEFIVLNTIKFGQELERIREFGKWNPYLVKTILELKSKEYRFINKYNRDYRYDKIILVRASSELFSQEDLIYKLLKTEYKGNFHEIKIYDYLVEKNIYSSKDRYFEKKLHAGLKIVCEEKIEIDNLGVITLK